MATETAKALKAHIAIHVRNVANSIDFYRKLFGIEPCKVRTGYAKFDVANPPLNFTLNEGATEERSGLHTRDEMKTECCYALQDKTWVRDPDGHEWEVFAVLEDNLPEKAHTEKSCCAPDCCLPAAP